MPSVSLSSSGGRLGAALLVALTVALGAAGCAVLGPSSIEYGRAAYSDALIDTNGEQVLATIVRMRYGEPTGLLAVTSVTANLQFQTNIGSEFGIGSDSSFEGNLTPLSAGIAYEENPTISYAPVQSGKYMRQLHSPLPIDLTVLLLGSLGQTPQVMEFLVRGINGIRNPDFVTEPGVEPDPRFARIAELLAELSRGGYLTWSPERGEPASYALLLSGEGEGYAQRVRELYDLLGFAAPSDLDEVVRLPVDSGIGRPGSPAIRLSTRSLYELLGIAAACVEVPDEHVQSGFAPAVAPAGTMSPAIRIRASSSRPWGASVKFKRYGWWFFVDFSDSQSKLTFHLLEALVSVAMSDNAEMRAPVLTVPASH